MRGLMKRGRGVLLGLAVVLPGLMALPTGAATLDLISPNGGEAWTAGEWISIEWVATGLDDEMLEVWLLRDGEKYVYISSETSLANETFWQVCDRLGDGATYRVQVICTMCDPPLEDASDADFSISGSFPPPTVSLESPLGGEVLTAGTSLPITWSSTDPSGYLAIWLLKSGSLRELLGHVPMESGELLWETGPFLPTGDDYTIRLTWYDRCGPAVSETSEAPFTILTNAVTPTITLTRPNGGELFYTDTVETITWESTSPTGSVEIWLTDDATRYELLGTAPLAAGQFEWPILACTEAGGALRVLLRWAEDGGVVTDESDADFALEGTYLPTITIMQPAAGATWPAGTTQLVEWTADASLGEVDLELSSGTYLGRFPLADGGGIVELCPGVGDGARTIRARMGPCGVDAVSGEFTITGSVTPTLTLLAPVGGETWPAGTPQVIEWESTGLTGLLDIYLPNDGQTQWGHVAVPVTDGTYTWWIPPTLIWPLPGQEPQPGDGVWLRSYDCGPVLAQTGGTIQITPAVVPFGDFDVDADIDLLDVAPMQHAFSGRGPVLLEAPADFFDAEPDADVDLDDAVLMLSGLTGPVGEDR